MALSRSFLGSTSIDSGGTSPVTWTTAPLGAVDANRRSVIVIATDDADSITGLTIGGEVATKRIEATDSGQTTVIFDLFTGTGSPLAANTSANIVATYTEESVDDIIQFFSYRIVGDPSVLHDTDSNVGGTATRSLTALTVPTDGVGIFGYINDDESVGVSWAGATEDADLTSASMRGSSASTATVGTNTISATGDPSNSALVGVSYAPSGATQNINLAGIFNNAQTFYAPVLTASYIVTPGLHTNSPTFYAPTVAQDTSRVIVSWLRVQIQLTGDTTQTIFPSLYTDPDTIYTPSVAQLNKRRQFTPINYY